MAQTQKKTFVFLNCEELFLWETAQGSQTGLTEVLHSEDYWEP